MENYSNSVSEKQSHESQKTLTRSAKHEIELNPDNLDLYCTKSKRTVVKILRFERQSDRDGREENVNDKTLKKLSKVIHSSNLIQYLEINCSKYQQGITDKGMRDLCRTIQKLNHLKGLSFDLTGDYKIFKTSFNDLNQALKGLTSLKKLKLRFSRWKINEKELRTFCKSVRKLKHLENLSLNFKGCDGIDDKSLEIISSAFKILGGLQSIHLNFKGCDQITTVGMQSLGQALKKGARSLRDVNLNFKRCERIDVRNPIFYQDLEALSSLQSLCLAIHSRSETITNENVQPLCQTLKKLVLLRKINLDFSSCRDMNNKGLFALGQTLKTQTALKDLGFHLYTYQGVTDQGMHDFSQTLNALESLESLSLSLLGIEMVCWRGISDLNQALMNLKNLRKIDLKFSR